RAAHGLAARAEGRRVMNTVALAFDLGGTELRGALVERSGDVIVLHTDGVTEAEDQNKRLFGFERLSQSVQRRHGRSAEEIKTGIVDDLMAHIGIQKIHDDIT
ncbi:hypothetical protein EN834_35575, partial [bacterium M00.F.Ca.ET.191.01.1.1]